MAGEGFEPSSARLRRAPALLAAAAEDKDKFLELEVCTVSPQDPWHLGYLAALGILPETPDQGTLQDLMLREDISFEEVLPVRRVVVAEPSAIDLSNRLRPPRAFTPQGFSFFGLISRPARTTHAALDGWLADRGAFARQNGPVADRLDRLDRPM